ncbi:MAG: discoidin domain-containing protein [Oxalobacteraceae bacterium]|nr:MAG: discoidin domain-containing protein [Oxalobacteraceae bacterium]
MRLFRSTDGTSWVQKASYNLADNGLGPITRYGFLTHHYSSGTTDTLIVPTAYSTEFPAPVVKVRKAQYWRVRWLVPNGGGSASIAEIEMAASAGGPDQCTGGTPTSSSFFAGYANVGNAFDDDANSYWQSVSARGGVNEWAQYQFAAPVSVAELRLTPAPNSESGPANAPSMFALDYSNDGRTWQIAMLGGTTDWTGGGKQAFTVPVSAT